MHVQSLVRELDEQVLADGTGDLHDLAIETAGLIDEASLGARGLHRPTAEGTTEPARESMDRLPLRHGALLPWLPR
jgi:hypothetical protein